MHKCNYTLKICLSKKKCACEIKCIISLLEVIIILFSSKPNYKTYDHKSSILIAIKMKADIGIKNITKILCHIIVKTYCEVYKIN